MLLAKKQLKAIDINEIKKELKQIAKNIKDQPINKSELQNFISSDNTKKIEKLQLFLTNHVNKVARSSLTTNMKLQVELQINDPTNIDNDIETNLIKVRKTIIPCELLNSQNDTIQTDV